MRKCSTVSESYLPNNVLMCVKSSWSEFGGLYHEEITNIFELCVGISIDIRDLKIARRDELGRL